MKRRVPLIAHAYHYGRVAKHYLPEIIGAAIGIVVALVTT